MSFIIKKIKKKTGEFKKYYSQIKYYKENEPVIYLNLKRNTKVRTYLNLIFQIKQTYQQPIVISFSFLNILLLSRWFSEIDNLYLASPLKKNNIFRKFSYKKNADFIVDYKYENVYNKDAYAPNVVPYIMHPQNYQTPTAVHDKKHIGIIISGNFEDRIYNNNELLERFGVVNRALIYKVLLRNSEAVEISGKELMQDYLSNLYLQKMVIMKWQSGAIPSPKWRYYLSAARFIFCAPGMTMPLCHNIIEALSVGTVPILNYKNWMNPSLEDGVNCLVYDDENSMDAVIKLALSLDEVAYEKMRQNCLEYYEKYYKQFDFEKNRYSNITLVNEDKNDLPDLKMN